MSTNLTFYFLSFVICVLSVTSARRHNSNEIGEVETWTGRWLPDRPSTESPHITPGQGTVVAHSMMGVKNRRCDDAKTNLTLDWDESFEDYICFTPRTRIRPNTDVRSLIEFENIPRAYVASHYCMDSAIHYASSLPTFGSHRPLWPKYGEYSFVPVQRWLHNLEHGAIVALYHPCADVGEVEQFKAIVRTCLRRHVISPYRHLDSERPFALLAWGVRLTMPVVRESEMTRFIMEHALKGPEKLYKDGQFDRELTRPAAIVSDIQDSLLCPRHRYRSRNL